MIAAKKKFFALNDDVKRQYQGPAGTLLGYIPFDKERYNPNTYEVHEGFLMLSEDEDNLPYSQIPSLLPAAAKAFPAKAFPAFRDLSSNLMSALSVALGQGKDYLARMHQEFFAKKGYSCLRVNHFPPMEILPPPNSVRFGAHKDVSTFTILMTGDKGGLQICNRAGAWMDVPPNKLLVIAGQFLHFTSHEKFIAPVHRVMIPDNADRDISRFSIIFFICPDAHLPYRPACIEEPEPCTWKDYYSSFLSDYLTKNYQKKE
ncbi:Gibberellin 2-beta-dioxygenase 3 [Chionoecetes opilio]|uniref:Gibberellin 2-beta-dioxygenase 3 n=1 Tax=Chionoecetes opilio TaxID=41210 RepID=A0A8J4YE59_CHIOP|nr:Gibberellin 2-beta-dioxygenase 3 [Chionoecetes opilio]